MDTAWNVLGVNTGEIEKEVQLSLATNCLFLSKEKWYRTVLRNSIAVVHIIYITNNDNVVFITDTLNINKKVANENPV